MQLFKSNIRYRYFEPAVIGVSYLLITLVVLWSATIRYLDYTDYHRQLADKVTVDLVEVIEATLQDHQRQVRLFAKQYQTLIRTVASFPENDDQRDQLEAELRHFFPDAFAFTLARNDGMPLLEDYEGYVGDLCLTDIRDFGGHHQNTIRVHPNPYVYHYDIMTQWGENEGILMISFPTDKKSALLQVSQAPGHSLYVVQPDIEHLIEITAQGARNASMRPDYRMSPVEHEHVMASMPIANTKWSIVDLIKPEFLSAYQRKLIIETLALLSLFGVLSLIVMVVLRRNAAVRRRAEALKDDFVSVVSHELRTPLTSIQGSLALLKGGVAGDISDKARTLFGIALKNTDRLCLLVDDLLDIRSIESGEMRIEMSEVDIMKLIDKAIDQNRGYAAKFNVRLVIRESLYGVCVNADPLRIGQVLNNLLTNAIKFSPPGGVVEIYARYCGSESIEIAIRDHGPGVDVSFQPYLFEKFAREECGDARMGTGTGLGLSIAKQLVEAHQGSIGFETTQGQGSTFYFHLPINTTPYQARRQAS